MSNLCELYVACMCIIGMLTFVYQPEDISYYNFVLICRISILVALVTFIPKLKEYVTKKNICINSTIFSKECLINALVLVVIPIVLLIGLSYYVPNLPFPVTLCIGYGFAIIGVIVLRQISKHSSKNSDTSIKE